MSVIKVKAPAKINLTLEISDIRADGYHNLKSIMHSINLYDYLTVEVSDFEFDSIYIECDDADIPTDKNNIVYKIAEKFLNKLNANGKLVKIQIEKNIPSQAGLGGGSADGAAVLFALNKIFQDILSNEELDEICAQIGSDLNFCFYGGCALCSSRGEKLEKLPPLDIPISIIKPKEFGVSTKEAYAKFDECSDKSSPNATENLKKLILQRTIDEKLLFNSFEKALFPSCNELSELKKLIPDSLMTGSGAAFFVLQKELDVDIDKDKYIVIENLKTISTGVETVYYEQ